MAPKHYTDFTQYQHKLNIINHHYNQAFAAVITISACILSELREERSNEQSMHEGIQHLMKSNTTVTVKERTIYYNYKSSSEKKKPFPP